jgi:hypothetical protein
MCRNLLGEDVEPGPHEAGHAIGVPTRASTVNEVTDLEDPIGAQPVWTAVREPFHGVCQVSEPVHARSALPGPLALHVPGHVRELGQRTHVSGQERHHAGPEGRAGGAGRLLGEGRLPEDPG